MIDGLTEFWTESGEWITHVVTCVIRWFTEGAP